MAAKRQTRIPTPTPNPHIYRKNFIRFTGWPEEKNCLPNRGNYISLVSKVKCLKSLALENPGACEKIEPAQTSEQQEPFQQPRETNVQPKILKS